MFMTYISDIITQGEENLSIRDLNLLYIPLNLSTRNAIRSPFSQYEFATTL